MNRFGEGELQEGGLKRVTEGRVERGLRKGEL